MSYPWNNHCRLQTLSASGDGNVLVFTLPTEQAEVHFADGEISWIICHAAGAMTRIAGDGAIHRVVGDGNTQRDVWHYLTPGGPAPQLRLGITRHRGPGTWSSLPHPFELEKEPGFEEVFFYLLKGGSRRGIQVGQGRWCDGGEADEIWPVTDRSFSTIPMGYHPVVGEPEVRVSYVWAYVAKTPRWEKI